MKTATIALLGLLASVPAMAQQGGWSSYQMGGRTYYNGTGDNQGWQGSGYHMGGRDYYNFQDPNGRSTQCSSYQMGGRTYTNCQ